MKRLHKDKNVRLYRGDCLKVMRRLIKKGVRLDSIVTDPPYHLTSIVQRFGAENAKPAKVGKTGAFARASRGFMGQQWDGGDVAFQRKTWELAYRLLKPGGHLIAFSGTRTYHRMAVAIEDAGFEIRDQMAWMYGCLTDDTEVLTKTGWRSGLDLKKGDMIAAWDAETGAIKLSPALKLFKAPYKGDMVRFVNHDTDQVLTPNHRVYHKKLVRKMENGVRVGQYSDWQVQEASEINRWQQMKLPLAGYHDGNGIGGEDYAALLAWVWTEGSLDRKGTGVRIYQSRSAKPKLCEKISRLLNKIGVKYKKYKRFRRYEYKGVKRGYQEWCWFFTGPLAQQIRKDLPKKHPTYKLLWRMTQQEKLAFWDAAMLGDGSGYQFFQKSAKDLRWMQTLLALTGRKGKIGTKNGRSDSVIVSQGSTTDMVRRHLVNVSQPYQGTVWCVQVDTGAFVVRRAGKVFITGNSGFPKSHDVSKGIDKAKGKKRKVLSQVRIRRIGMRGGTEHINRKNKNTYKYRPGDYQKGENVLDITAPASKEAKRWNGWGTALKPAWEPIVLARKPLIGTVAENVLTHGTGALNIDGCRIGTFVNSTPSGMDRLNAANARQGYRPGTYEKGPVPPSGKEGRWPANVIHDGSDEVLEAFAAYGDRGAAAPVRGDEPSPASEGNVTGRRARVAGVFHGDTGTAARFFYSAKASKADRAGSKHPTVKPIALMRYLCRLVTPPGGRTMDMFCGSGSSVAAALQEGVRIIAIEQSKEYCKDIMRRIKRHYGKPEGKMPTLWSK